MEALRNGCTFALLLLLLWLLFMSKYDTLVQGFWASADPNQRFMSKDLPDNAQISRLNKQVQRHSIDLTALITSIKRSFTRKMLETEELKGNFSGWTQKSAKVLEVSSPHSKPQPQYSGSIPTSHGLEIGKRLVPTGPDPLHHSSNPQHKIPPQLP